MDLELRAGIGSRGGGRMPAPARPDRGRPQASAVQAYASGLAGAYGWGGWGGMGGR
ncbi:catalase, partial [Streptomyces azureus]